MRFEVIPAETRKFSYIFELKKSLYEKQDAIVITYMFTVQCCL